MNDPKVVALIYRVGPENSKRFDKASPLRYCQSPEFDLTVEEKVARFEFKKFYATEAEALEVVKPFIRQWEFDAEMQGGPDSFSLLYEGSEIDRKPSPSEPGVRRLRAHLRIPAPTISARVSYSSLHYPPPPTGGPVDLVDCYVDRMRLRYNQYRQGEAKLPEVAYFCVDALEKKFKGIPAAAKACGISRSVLEEIKKLSSYKGGKDSRKAEGVGDEFTNQERRFLKAALKEIIIRAAQVAADDSQRHPLITMADLPKL